jgi:hypothetical protein
MFVVVIEAKKGIKIVAEMPREVAPLAIYYLSLFRPQSGRAVSVAKSARLIAELRDLVANGHVQHNRLPARTCPPRIWAEAISTMVDNRLGLKLPMPNHNYLIKVAYDRADALDRERESAVRVAEQSHRRPSSLNGAEEPGRGEVKSVPAPWAITD